MFWSVLVGMLAAFGALCAAYIIALPARSLPGAMVLTKPGHPWQELKAISRHKRLYGLGLIKCPLIIVGSTLCPKEQQLLAKRHPELIFYTQADYIACILGEKNHAGTGDLTRHHCYGGVSEL